MPEKSLSVATYAAGAGLAAVTLIYVFAPTYFIDSDSNSSRKKGAVGLANPANDCFINSVLQALAGLGDLRKYLIREVHRRSLDEQWVYNQPVNSPETRNMHDVKVIGLQVGLVTKGLKDMLDSLNERPLYKKTITTSAFIRVLEHAFHQRISRQQQDAQEFLQIVAERLCEEYHAGRRARIAARNAASVEESSKDDVAPTQSAEASAPPDIQEERPSPTSSSASVPIIYANSDEDEEEGFPMEGAFQSQIECMTCHFKPKPKESKFCTLTLNVPQASSTTLNACFDVMFKKEDIEDWKCEKCRLQHALEEYQKLVQNATSADDLSALQIAVDKLRTAVDKDPESPPEGVRLPDGRHAPSRRIERHTYITKFPKILAIHLSRSIFSSYSSQKNSAKVAFPEALKVGSLSHGMKNYKLLGVVTHKGNHYSGHYESFRRQNVPAPFSTPNTFQRSGVYSKTASPSSTPQMKALKKVDGGSPLASTPDLLSPEDDNNASSQSLETGATFRASVDTARVSVNGHASSSRLNQLKDGETSSIRSVAASAKSTLSRLSIPRSGRDGSVSPKADQTVTVKVPKRKKKGSDKWWRISDEKVKEARTSEVLGMQREVYLLFYELCRDD